LIGAHQEIKPIAARFLISDFKKKFFVFQGKVFRSPIR
jgi:hypothetical protein